MAISVVLAYLVVLLIGTVLIWRSPAEAYLTLGGVVAAGVGALSLVTAAWLGLCFGRSVHSAFTAPLATVLGIALLALLGELDLWVSGPRFSLMLPTLETPRATTTNFLSNSVANRGFGWPLWRRPRSL